MKINHFILVAGILLSGASCFAAQQEVSVPELSKEYTSFTQKVNQLRKNLTDLDHIKREYNRCYKMHVAPIEVKIRELEGRLQSSDLQTQQQLRDELNQLDRLREQKYGQHCQYLSRRIKTLETLIGTTTTLAGLAATALITILLHRYISKKMDTFTWPKKPSSGKYFGSGAAGGTGGTLTQEQLRQQRRKKFEKD